MQNRRSNTIYHSICKILENNLHKCLHYLVLACYSIYMNWNKAVVIGALALSALGVSGCNFASNSAQDATTKIESQFRAEAANHSNVTVSSVNCVKGTGMCLYTVKVNSEANEYGHAQRTVSGQCTLTKIGKLDCTNDGWMQDAAQNMGKVDTPEANTVPSTSGDLSVSCPNLGTCTPTDPARR